MSGSIKPKQDNIELLVLRREDIKRLARPHAGYEQLVGPLVAAAREFPDVFEGINLTALASHVATAQALKAPCAQAEQQLRLLEDTRFYHSSNGWSLTLLLYDRAKSAARVNPSIAQALEAFEAFLKHKKKPVTPAPVTPSSTT